jgi:hypothetical protein
MRRIAAIAIAFCLAAAAVVVTTPARAAVTTIKNRTINQPLVLDQNDDYILHKVYISGVSDVAALTLTGKISSVRLSSCVFSNIWAGATGKASAAEAQGAIVGQFTAVDTAFEDAQHQLLCLREGAFGTVTFQRCKFRTTDSFLKKIYAEDPWRTTPPTCEFANIDRLELFDNEYVNTILIVHPSVKTVVLRGDISNLRLESPSTHVIRLEKDQDPASLGFDRGAVASADPANSPVEDDPEAAPAPPSVDGESAAQAPTDAADPATEDVATP